MNTSVNEILWILSLSSVSFFGAFSNQYINRVYPNHNYQSVDDIPDDVLFGYYSTWTDKHKARVEDFMSNYMRVDATYKVKSKLNDLLNSKSDAITSMNHAMLQLYRFSEKDLKAENNKDFDNKTSNEEIELTRQLDFVKSVFVYRSSWTKDAMYAYNLANAIQLVRFAGYFEYLNREQVIENLVSISRAVADNFKSYYDFGYKSTVAFYVENARLSVYKFKGQLNEEKNRFSHVMYGTWSNMTWKGAQNGL